VVVCRCGVVASSPSLDWGLVTGVLPHNCVTNKHSHTPV
jgi:hypothetical protein